MNCWISMFGIQLGYNPIECSFFNRFNKNLEEI